MNVHIVVIDAEGRASSVPATSGESVMRAAVGGSITGIVAECGGALACATCHVYVAPEWAGLLAAPGPDEDEMLDCVSDRRPESRLSCQIVLEPSLDGMVVNVPASQY